MLLLKLASTYSNRHLLSTTIISSRASALALVLLNIETAAAALIDTEYIAKYLFSLLELLSMRVAAAADNSKREVVIALAKAKNSKSYIFLRTRQAKKERQRRYRSR